MQKSKVVLIIQVAGVTLLVICLCGLAYGVWLGECKSTKRADKLSPMESARNDDTSNFDNVLRF